MPLRILLFLLACVMCAFPLHAENFPQEEQKAYLEACTGGNVRLQPYCNCTLSELQKRMSVEEYHALSKLPQDDVINDAKFNASVSACSYYFR